MPPDFSLNEDMLTLLNPLPPTTMAEVYHLIDNDPASGESKPRPHPMEDDPVAQKKLAFEIKIEWSAGPERQQITLRPGEKKRVPAKAARQIHKGLAEKGLVLLADGEDELAKRSQGLRRAHEFYQARGLRGVQKWRRRHGIQPNSDQEREMRGSVGGMFVNLGRARAIVAEQRRLKASQAKRESAPKPAAAAAK